MSCRCWCGQRQQPSAPALPGGWRSSRLLRQGEIEAVAQIIEPAARLRGIDHCVIAIDDDRVEHAGDDALLVTLHLQQHREERCGTDGCVKAAWLRSATVDCLRFRASGRLYDAGDRRANS